MNCWVLLQLTNEGERDGLPCVHISSYQEALEGGKLYELLPGRPGVQPWQTACCVLALCCQLCDAAALHALATASVEGGIPLAAALHCLAAVAGSAVRVQTGATTPGTATPTTGNPKSSS